MRIRHCIPATLVLAIAGTAFAQQQAPTPAPPQQRTAEEQKTMPPPDPRWTRLDADADGRISAIEADKDSAFGITFDDMDTDDDGFVSSAEYTTFGSATAAQPAPPPPDMAAASSASTGAFSGLDKDKDGRVSSTEAGANPDFDSGFAAMDSNGDGFVTDAEFNAHAQATKQP